MNKDAIHQALKEYTEQHRPPGVDLWPLIQQGATAQLSATAVSQRSNHRIGRLPAAPRHWGFAGMLLAAGILVVGTLMLTTRPAPVSAEQVLARAASSGTSNPADVQRLHGVYVTRYRNDPTAAFSDLRQESWYQAPDRVVGQAVTRLPDGRQITQWMGEDGSTSYSYNPTDQQFLLRPALDSGGSFQATSLNDVLAEARGQTTPSSQDKSATGPSHMYDAQLVGTEVVAGRMAYVIDLHFVPGATLQFPDKQVPDHVKWWIDQKVFFVLREEGWDAQGRLMRSSAYESLEINAPLNPAVFNFAAPANAAVLDLRPATAEETQRTWRDTAKQAAYGLWAPTYTSTELAAGRPTYNAVQGVVLQAYYDNRFQDQPGSRMVVSPAVVIKQESSLRAKLDQRGLAVALGKGTGYIRTEAGVITLVFEQGGTNVQLRSQPSSIRLSQAMLIDIAQSMQPVVNNR